MSDSSGNRPHGSDGADSGSSQQPPAYPPPQQNPYGQPPPPPSQQPHAASDQPQSAPPQQPFGQPGYGQPGQHGQPAYGYGQPGAVDPDKRPATVTAAAIITIALSALAALGSAGLLAFAIAQRDALVDQVRREVEQDPNLAGLNPETVFPVVVVAFAAVLAWAIGAVLLAVFVLRRSNGARIGLVVSAILSSLGSLVFFAAVFPLLWTFGAMAVVILLFTGGAGAWFSRHSGGQKGQRRGGLAPPVA